MKRQKVQTYTREKLSDKTAVITRVRAELGEWFDDYVLIARSRCPDQKFHILTDYDWACGAMEKLLEDLHGN